jgi:NDP-sugar pyrophosphorylase family protein
MNKPTLLILAAGMGSRYGGNKQLDGFGPNNEAILEYSLFDAIKAGFGKIVFIIREELRNDFELQFGAKIKDKIEYEYAIQGVQSYVPASLGVVSRTKPWGTGHATLCAWEATKTSFAVINADDFYGYEAFEIMAKFLSENDEKTHSMVGYQIQNTLSENGTVARGVCVVNIFKKESGEIVFEEADNQTVLMPETPVSMNFWGFHLSVFPMIKEMFDDYAVKNIENPKAEFFIPLVMSKIVESGRGVCKVFSNKSEWFGVTYSEDKPSVKSSIKKLIKEGKYPVNLWA